MDQMEMADIDAPLPYEPTRELPGTESKVAVLQERYENGFALFHPRDATNENLGTDLLDAYVKLSE